MASVKFQDEAVRIVERTWLPPGSFGFRRGERVAGAPNAVIVIPEKAEIQREWR